MFEQQGFDAFQAYYIADLVIECVCKINNDENLKEYSKKHELIAKFVMTQREEVLTEVFAKLCERQIGEE